MKIIKHGNVPEHQFTCNICGCEFIADYNEYEHVLTGICGAIIDDYYTTTCPDCGNTVKQDNRT